MEYYAHMEGFLKSLFSICNEKSFGYIWLRDKSFLVLKFLWSSTENLVQ